MVTELGPKVQKTPILMLLGEDDMVVCNEKAKMCFDAMKGVQEKEFYVYQDQAHHGMLQDD